MIWKLLLNLAVTLRESFWVITAASDRSPSLHVTNLDELRAIVKNLQENRNVLAPNH